MRYEGPIYRPPSESDSLLIQATVGCPHNKCSFCMVYKRGPRFRMRPVTEICEDLEEAKRLRNELHREGWKSFLASEDLNEKVGSAEWSARIDEAIDRSGVVVVIVSPDSRKSPWVEYEWRP